MRGPMADIANGRRAAIEEAWPWDSVTVFPKQVSSPFGDVADCPSFCGLDTLWPTVPSPPLQLSSLAYHQRLDVESMEKQPWPTLKGDCLEKEGPAGAQRKPAC